MRKVYMHRTHSIHYMSKKQSKEPVVRTTLRVPESLMDRFMASYTHLEAHSINDAMCQLITAHVETHERTHETAQHFLQSPGLTMQEMNDMKVGDYVCV